MPTAVGKYISAAIISVILLTCPFVAASVKPSANAPAGKYDTKLPVEISSDTLEVLQQQNKAIFKGNVVAVQGKIRIKSDVMVVHYNKQQDNAAPKPNPVATPGGQAAAPSGPAGAMGAITLIEVEGHVFVATPEESAKGDKGNYQVDEKLLHLNGSNVVLTRDTNILRGTELEYNLETGHSVLTNHGGKAGIARNGRVRSVFVPQNKEKPRTGADAVKDTVKPARTTVISPVAQ